MILVVDHDPEVLERAREVLDHGLQVLLASSAEQALQMVQQLGFSVALVDMEMPGSAQSLSRQLHEADPDLLIVAVSSANLPAHDEFEELGIVEALRKPISVEWKSVVERICALRQAT